MMALLKRKSIISFIAIALIGAFLPFFLQGHPADSVGAPFAKPIFWSSKLPSSVQFDITEAGLEFEWDKQPPAIYSLSGMIKGDPNQKIVIRWNTPNNSHILAELSGQELYWINMDGRDMIFKQALNLPLIGKSVEHLFPEKGRYSLTIDGSHSSELKLSLPGERNGLLGTDQRGRDVFKLLVYGIRTSLLVGISATIIATVLGLGFGLIAGYSGGLLDSLIMRAVDILMSIPTLPILMVLAGIWGKGLWQLILILSIFSWMGTARSVRSLILTVRESSWIEGLKALGAKKSYILGKHLLPETAPILLANIALGVPGAILSEAALAFLGLSDPRLISWGRMLHEAHTFGAFTEGAWWLLLPPGIGIVALCLIFMDIGRYLEELIDPRLGSDKNA